MSKVKRDFGVELLRQGMPHSANLLSNDEMGELFGGGCGIYCQHDFNCEHFTPCTSEFSCPEYKPCNNEYGQDIH